jgi:hypothetical protein
LVVMQLRSRLLQPALPRRRLSIRMEAHDHPEMARPVPITHVKQPNAPSPTGLRAP